MRNEDYGRISRLLADKTAVELEFNIVNHVYPEGKTSYNAIAEIPGIGQGRRSRDARRPPRFVARGDRRDRQRDRLRGDDGGGAHPQGDRREAAPDDPRGAVERRGAGPARVAGLREGALRHVRKRRSRSSRSSTATSTSTRARAASAARRSSGRRRPATVLREAFAPFEDFGMLGAGATRSRAPAAPTARRSTKPACRASASARIRLSIRATPGTPTSTPTSASSKTT